MTTPAELDRRRLALVVGLLLLLAVDAAVVVLVLRGRDAPPDLQAARGATVVETSAETPSDAASPTEVPAAAASADPASSGSPSPATGDATLAPDVPVPPTVARPLPAPGLSDPALTLFEGEDATWVVQEPGDGCDGHQVWRRSSPTEVWQRPGCLPAVGLPAVAPAAVDFSSALRGVVSLRGTDGAVVVFRTGDGGATWTEEEQPAGS